MHSLYEYLHVDHHQRSFIELTTNITFLDINKIKKLWICAKKHGLKQIKSGMTFLSAGKDLISTTPLWTKQLSFLMCNEQ